CRICGLSVLSLFVLLFYSLLVKLLVQEAGTSVQMQILEPNFSTSSFDELYWKFNKNKIIIFDQEDVEKYGDFKDRMEFNKETCMLTLNNLKKTDSGLYEAIASADTDRSVAKYTLSVMVEAPVLTVYNSTDPCNITLTCRGHDLSITSTCYNETCEEKEVTSPGGVTLSLSVWDSIIICNHSNLVSWKQEYKTLTHLCADKGTHTHTQRHLHTHSILKLLC
uniref:Immunoglobulin subtype domain-containing protein n=1 Tax=Astyanax mexicanus TaxID=7994 RepID=A0A8B9I1K9_ASTMX